VHAVREPLDGKTILITGATRGIGFAAADALARMGARVIVHGRDQRRVQNACEAIGLSAPRGAVHGVVAELDSLDAVRGLAQQIAADFDRLDVLINNAGLITRRRQETVDAYERQFAVNHLAPFLLTRLLLDKLAASPTARIVTVASMAHHRAEFDLDDLNWVQRRYSGIGAYGATKLANILFTRELSRRLDGRQITANCLHPGVVATNIFSGMGLLGTLFGLAARPFLRSIADGAKTTVYLAADDEVAGISGEFFSDAKRVEPAPAARDEAAALRLWQISEQLTGLSGTTGSGPTEAGALHGT
jgi:retinol dehydrogenase-12